MGAYARVGDADVMPGLRPEPLCPWMARPAGGGRRRPTDGADPSISFLGRRVPRGFSFYRLGHDPCLATLVSSEDTAPLVRPELCPLRDGSSTHGARAARRALDPGEWAAGASISHRVASFLWSLRRARIMGYFFSARHKFSSPARCT